MLLGHAQHVHRGWPETMREIYPQMITKRCNARSAPRVQRWLVNCHGSAPDQRQNVDQVSDLRLGISTFFVICV